jgi:ABC-type glycerol-3-phosphate transport system substrate-binding protein
MVVDFDGSISTELALYSNKEEYNDILTHELPLGNDGEKLPAQVVGFGPVIPKGAKKVAAAKEFINYMREPKVLNEYLKGSLGRFAIPMPEIARSDPFWLNEDPHRTAHTQQALIGPTLPIYEAYNPAVAEVNAEHVFSIAEFDVMNNGMAPGQAIDKAFKRAEAIFAKYQIVQG